MQTPETANTVANKTSNAPAVPNTAVSLDIETLSTNGRAVVLSLGICIFKLDEIQSFDEIVENGIELFFEKECQFEMGRKVDQSTLDWWAKQGEEARRVFDADPDIMIHPRDFYKHLNQFCEDRGVNLAFLQNNARWFARGPTFDMSILDSMFSDFNVTVPWKYWLVRDIRTHLEALGIDTNIQLRRPDNMIHHNALHDAAYDVWALQQVLHKPLTELDIVSKR